MHRDTPETIEERNERRWRQASTTMYLVVTLIGLMVAAIFRFG